jgi:hypothetical protein
VAEWDETIHVTLKLDSGWKRNLKKKLKLNHIKGPSDAPVLVKRLSYLVAVPAVAILTHTFTTTAGMGWLFAWHNICISFIFPFLLHTIMKCGSSGHLCGALLHACRLPEQDKV